MSALPEQRHDVPYRMSYPVTEAALLLGIGKTLMYELVKDGQIRAVRIQGRTLIRRDEIMAFLDRRQDAA